jgi:hypothetical protein
VAFERVAGFENRRDPALRPGGRACRNVAFGEDADAQILGKLERGAQARRPRPEDQDVEGLIRHRRLQRASG